MFLSSGGDGGNNKRLLFLLLSMVLFLSLFISPVYADSISTSSIKGSLLYIDDSDFISIKFIYNNVNYDLHTAMKSSHFENVSNLNYFFIGDGSNLLDFYICDKVPTVYKNKSGLYFFDAGFTGNFRCSVSVEDKEIIVTSTSLGNTILTDSVNFLYSSCDIYNDDGSVFFYRIRPLVTSPMIQGAMVQVVALIPIVLLLTVSYLALRKCLSFLLKILRIS